jgi:hypothetical protein
LLSLSPVGDTESRISENPASFIVWPWMAMCRLSLRQTRFSMENDPIAALDKRLEEAHDVTEGFFGLLDGDGMRKLRISEKLQVMD